MSAEFGSAYRDIVPPHEPGREPEESLADVAPGRRDRFDDPVEVMRDLVQLHVAKLAGVALGEPLSPAHVRRYASLFERAAGMNGLSLPDMGAVLVAAVKGE